MKMSVKERLGEKVTWGENEERNYTEWKLRNVRHMSLKESKLKQNVQSGPFEEFCAIKGIERKKGIWERNVEKENDLKEHFLKETKIEREKCKIKKKENQLIQKM
jgi:hypothetical protein